MTVGFLILNYNSGKLSGDLALKVAKYNRVDRVVIVDNCSSDGLYDGLLKLAGGKLDVIQSEKNGGYAYGNNYGAHYCERIGVDVLFISNPDVDIDEEDLNRIIDAFEETDFAVLSGVEYDSYKKISYPPVWKQMSYYDDLMDCFFIGRKLCKAKRGVNLDRSSTVQETELVKGSFLGVRLKRFIEIGGFDEGTFLFCEERILGRRMAQAGERIGVVTGAKYYHNHSTTINKTFTDTARQIELLYSSRLYYHKHYTTINPLKTAILAAAMKISVTEYKVADRIK